MSNYPCSVVHRDGDPVGNQFQISSFTNFLFYSLASLIQLSVNKGVMLHEYVQHIAGGSDVTAEKRLGHYAHVNVIEMIQTCSFFYAFIFALVVLLTSHSTSHFPHFFIRHDLLHLSSVLGITVLLEDVQPRREPLTFVRRLHVCLCHK